MNNIYIAQVYTNLVKHHIIRITAVPEDIREQVISNLKEMGVPEGLYWIP